MTRQSDPQDKAVANSLALPPPNKALFITLTKILQNSGTPSLSQRGRINPRKFHFAGLVLDKRGNRVDFKFPSGIYQDSIKKAGDCAASFAHSGVVQKHFIHDTP
jgi:hypothetical protein